MDIWEQLKGESKRAYDNFKVYLELGSERTIKKTIKLTEKSASNIYRQFKKWNWEKRALEYDKFISNQNNKDDLIKKGFDKLKKSRFQQSLEFAETFKKLLDLIKEKIDIKQENIYKMELEEILKLSSSLSKTIPETIKALKLLIDESHIAKEEKNNLLSIFKNDKEVFELSEKLLKKISKD